MMHLKPLLLLIALVVIFFSNCQNDIPLVTDEEYLDIQLEVQLRKKSSNNSLDFFRLPNSNDFSNIPQDPNNPLSADKVELGKYLYHETGLAVNPVKAQAVGTYSCASCHFAAAGFQAGLKQGIAEGGIGFGVKGEGRVPDPSYNFNELDVQPIRTPSAMNGAFQPLMLWNGQFGSFDQNTGTEAQWTAGTPKENNHFGYQGLEIQAIAGLNVHRMKIDTSTVSDIEYRELFDRSFPSVPQSERYSREYAGLAIAAFERTLLANDAPFQNWIRGDKTAMTKQQKEGALIFFGKGGCSDCHTGPALNSMAFYALGMNDLEGEGTYGVDPNDATHLGRGGFTKNPADNFKFKVPQLYNLKDVQHLGHGGSFNSVRAVIEYKNAATAENSKVPLGQLANEFQPLNLSEDEVTALTDFILNGLYDPNLMRYQPGYVISGNCFPNNDPQSKTDLGCN